MYFNADRNNEEYLQPITPVLKCEEGPIEAMFTLFIVSRRSNQNHHQRESINYEGMAEVWNRQCLSECIKPLHERQKMFPKNLIISRPFTQSWKEGETKEKICGSGHKSCVMMV
jgi:hypothetical protein